MLCLSGLAVQGAKATVTMCLEGAHAEFIGQGKGLLVVGCGFGEFWRIAVHGDVAEEAKNRRLSSAFLMLTGEIEGIRCELECVI